MTAPAAITINSHQYGGKVLVTWHASTDAAVTDYNIYVGEYPTDPGLEDTYDADLDAEANGNYRWWSPFLAGTVSIYVTALNSGAEESDPSNTRKHNMNSAGDGTYTVLDPAVDLLRRIDL